MVGGESDWEVIGCFDALLDLLDEKVLLDACEVLFDLVVPEGRAELLDLLQLLVFPVVDDVQVSVEVLSLHLVGYPLQFHEVSDPPLQELAQLLLEASQEPQLLVVPNQVEDFPQKRKIEFDYFHK